MKGYLLAISLILFAALTAFSQRGTLMIKSGSKGLFLEHKVAAKENFYSIGRLYNVHPKHLATYNMLDMVKGLSLGQVVRIPLSDTNFNQKNDNGSPIYYTVGEKEGLFRVSSNNNKVLMASLRKWNHLSNDKLSPGNKLIVGFLQMGELKTVATADVQQNQTVKTEPQKEIKTEPEKTEPEKKEPKKKEPEKKEPEKKETPKNDVVVVPDESQKTNTVIQAKEQVSQEPFTGYGYFKSSFDQQVRQNPVKKDQTVTAGIFKTISGWSDTKYYVLLDGVEPGTVIKIINPTNSKTIYAKVLGEMSGIKENQGLNLRMSNSAAAALDIQELDKFIVRLNY